MGAFHRQPRRPEITGDVEGFKQQVAGKLALVGAAQHKQAQLYLFPGIHARRAEPDVNGVDDVNGPLDVGLAPDRNLLAEPDIPRAADVIYICL